MDKGSRESDKEEDPANLAPGVAKAPLITVAAAMADLLVKPKKKKPRKKKANTRVISPQATRLNLDKFKELVNKRRQEYATVGFRPNSGVTGAMRHYFDQLSVGARKKTGPERYVAEMNRKKERQRREETRRKARAEQQTERRKDFEKVLDKDKEERLAATRKMAGIKAAETKKRKKELKQKTIEEATQADSDSIDSANLAVSGQLTLEDLGGDETDVDDPGRLVIDEGDKDDGNETDDTTIGRGTQKSAFVDVAQDDNVESEDDDNIATRLRAVEVLKNPPNVTVPKGKLGGKKKGRISSGVKALQEIRKQQKDSHVSVFSKTGWIRFVRNITSDFTQVGAQKEVRMKPEAYEALMVGGNKLSFDFRFLL